ncbi:MAG: RNA polymerase sigma-70 factor [Bacteroidota bacterium]
MEPEKECYYVSNLKSGDLKAFRCLYDHYHQKVFGYCMKLCGDYSDAEEITVDVFVRLWEKRTIVDPSVPIGPLLFKITKDLVWNHLRKTSREKAQLHSFVQKKSGQFHDPSVEAQLTLNDYLNITNSAVKKLPPKRRTVFILHYKDGLDNKQISEQLNISESTVRVHLMKASRYLRDFMRAHPEMPLIIILGFFA